MAIYRVVPADEGISYSKKYGVVLGVTVLVTLALCLFFDDFVKYLGAVFSHWVALMSGVVSVGITFFEKVRHTLGRYALYAVALLCVFFSGYQAWREQVIERGMAEQKVKALTTPIIKGNIGMAGTGPGGASGLDCVVYAVVTVSNAGAPSALDVIAVTLRANGKEANGIPVPISKEKGITFDSSLGERHYDRDDVLPLKLSTPLPTGGEVTGLLLVFVPGISHLDARVRGTTVDVTLRDVYGGEHVIHKALDDMKGKSLDMKNLQPQEYMRPQASR